MVVNRREWFRMAAAAGAAISLSPRLLRAIRQDEMIMRTIPSTGERVPVVGLGSSATFSRTARSEDASALREVLGALVENGGRIFDTAPGYGASEEVAGRLANELGIADEIFWATKVNVAGRGGGEADPDAARAQIERSFRRFQVDRIDLIQVHNLGDVPTQLGILKELKEEGRVRYIGVTSTSERRYPDMAAFMRNEPIDFIGVDYAVDNRSAA
ncbi:MAG: aldo/keto reductase, partial [Gemmatimonadota bacterium]